jgi:hypothetical protein
LRRTKRRRSNTTWRLHANRGNADANFRLREELSEFLDFHPPVW